MAQTESQDQNDVPSNTTANASTGSINHQGVFNNGVPAHSTLSPVSMVPLPAHSTLPPVSMVPRTVNSASLSAASDNSLQSRIPFTAENGTSKQ